MKIRFAALLVLLSFSASAAMASFVPRWISTYDPPGFSSQYQSSAAARLLTDGSMMILGVENSVEVAVRFDANGVVLTKVTIKPPGSVWARQISPFGEVFIEGSMSGNGYVMKYDGVTGAAAWPAPAAFPSGGVVADAFTLDHGGNPIIGWDVGTTRYVRKFSAVDGAVLWTHVLAVPSGVITKAVTTDSGDNVMVSSFVGSTVNRNIYTTKLRASDGVELWSATYDNNSDDRPAFVAVDHSDNVFVVGTTLGTGTDVVILKYSGASGAEQWRAITAGPSSSTDTPTAVTMDAEDNISIAATYVNGAFTDAMFLRYTPSGTRVMYAAVSGNRDDVVSSIAVDGFGHLCYTGIVGGVTSGTDLTVGKLDRNTAVPIWIRTYDRTANQNDAGNVLAVNASGDVVIAATTYDNFSRDDVTFVKYSGTTGTRLALTHVDGNGEGAHYGYIMALGPGNQIHAAGESSGFDFQQFDGNTGAGVTYSASSGDSYGAIAVDAAGNRYEFTTFGSSFPDYALLKYSSGGLLLWQRFYNGPTNGAERALAMTLDGAANPIVSGTSFSAAAGSAIVTIKYNAAGTQQWVHTFNGTVATGNDLPVAVLTDANNDVFVAGTAVNTGTSNDLVVVKINGATGAQIWATPINGGASGFHDDAAFGLVLDAAGNPVVTGRLDNFSSADFAAVKLDNVTGGVIWNTRVPTAVGDEPHAIAIDGAGDVVLFGTTNVGTFTGDLFTVKLNGVTGAQLWAVPYDGGVGLDNGVAVRTDAANNIIVLGTVVRAAPQGQDLAIIRYTPAGAVDLGPTFYDSGTSDSASAMLMIGNEPVVLGRNGDRFLLIRYAEALGITTMALPPAYCNVPYNATVAALNGTPPYTWSVTSGLLPPGLTLDPSTGILSGSPGVMGAPFTPRIRVTDSTAAFFERDFRIEGFPGTAYTPVFTTANPVCGSATLSVGGSWNSYLWQPNGETTPAITPAPAHPTLFGVRLEDGFSCTTLGALRLDVIQPLSAVNVSVSGSASLCNVPTGGTATVADTGGGSSTHQWGYRTTPGGTITNLAGKTGTSYVITASDFPSGGTYYLVCRTTPFCGSPTTSNEVTVTINNPTVPGSLTATATADNRIDLSWGASSGSGVHHYNIYRSPRLCPGLTFTKIGQTTGTETTFADTTVVTGGSYAYKVTAADSGNSCETGFSNCDDAVAYGSCSLAPTFAGATSASANGCFVRVAWSAGTSNCPSFPNVVYSVYRSTSSTFTPSAANRIASCVINTAYDDDTVTAGTTYYYVVRAEDSSIGNGGPCNSGNEDANVVRVSVLATGSAVTSTLYADAFEAPNRPASNPDAYWIEQAQAGADHLSLSTCRSASTTTSYKWGNTATCPGSYASSVTSNLTLGGNGSVSPSINGIAITPALTNIRLRFRHYYSTESSWDGAALYYSTTGATGPFTIVNDSVTAGQPYILSGGYNGTLNIDGNHRAWMGSQTSFAQVVVNLDPLVGQTVWFRWRFVSDSVFNFEGYYLDDVTITGDTAVSCATPPNPVQALSVTSTNGSNQLEWLNPSIGSYGATMVRFRTDAFPASIVDGTLGTTRIGAAGDRDSWTHSGLTNGTTYYYAAFVDNGFGVWSRSRTVAARPQLVNGVVKWVYATGASAMTPPGIGSVFAVSNDRILHSMNPGASGGQWPSPWKPMVMNAPSQGRPPVPSFSLGAATKEVYLGSQDGHVYCVDGNTGAQIWRTATPIAEMVQAAANGMFTVYGGAYDLNLVGTRNSSAPNRLVGLDARTGAERWSFDNGGGVSASDAIGIISGDAAIEYDNRVFFASRAAAGGSNQTLWALSFTDTGATKLWSAAIGDSDGGPTVWNGRVYIGTNNGTLYAFNATTGALLWSYATNDGPVKGFVNVDFLSASGRLYFATTNKVWSVTDSGASATLNWSVSLTRPSVPLFTGTALLLGSGDGRLYQLTNLSSATPTQTSIILGAGTAGVGSPSFDYASSMVYVGNEAGAIYGVSVPLP